MAFSRLARPFLLALIIPVLGACEDELANVVVPVACEASLEFDVTDTSAEVVYDVVIAGSAIVRSITYTLPTGDETVVNPALPFHVEAIFATDAAARIQVTGEVAGNGEIGFGYLVFPQDPANNSDDFFLCLANQG